MNKLAPSLTIPLALGFLSACAIEPDNRGECPLSCENAAPVARAIENGTEVVKAEILPSSSNSDEIVLWCSAAGSSDQLDPQAATQPTRVQFRFTRIVIFPTITVSSSVPEQEVHALLQEAQRHCQVANSIASIVEVSPTIVMH